MNSIKFNQIIKQRKKDLGTVMAKKPLKELKKELHDAHEPKNFKKALQNKKRFPIICEYKPASPSLGNISSRGLKESIESFQLGGASAASILTEEKFFKGDINYIRQASELIDFPVMRKDFILDEYQIYEARVYGASSILLMSDIYPDISSGIEVCRSLGMEPLVECKNSIDVYKALNSDADVVGINNRSFQDFSIDLNRTKALAGLVPEEVLLVAESGVKSPEDAALLVRYGADALLVGTSVMGSEDIVATIQKMICFAESSLKFKSKRKSRGDEFFEQFA
ncbi:indole-3-glycerol phosphate synthase TrpC [Methanobacterium alcaliphilum]|uniref:indole-3-glycerol phosphate synthase TrpC n=1 Tax=Methanobacterium alcaliphilum TaxID=392018 RepID=UPI00200B13AB|nr:indole-3-glycerol-phosphate synthase [Methanobacterium alcaliphilum]MCK9152599.1 indole-3-glycerol-phosphate synthase [Methanobacterium alcaliphilum]